MGKTGKDNNATNLVKLSVNGASRFIHLASWIIEEECNCVNPSSEYQPPLWA